MLINTPWNTDELLQGSIIFLSETRRCDDVSEWFERHTVFAIPAETGRPGQGLLMAVPHSHSYHPQLVQSASDILGVLLRDGADNALALVLGVYMPTATSPRLQQCDIEARYATLHSILAEHAGVPVLIMGDFNCTHLPADMAPHAQALRSFAELNALQVCTDAPGIDWDFMWMPSSCPVPSFHNRNGRCAPRRIDHVLACSQMVDMHLVTRVLPNAYDMSDHYPITASFLVTPAVLPSPAGGSTARPPRVIWRSICQPAYAQHLLDQGHDLTQRMQLALVDGDVDAALGHLMQGVHDAAHTAGMRKGRGAPGGPGRAPGGLGRAPRGLARMPYLTQELRQLRRECWRSCRNGDMDAYRQMRRSFQQQLRCRKRMWLRHRARTVLSELKHDSHGVYAQLAGKPPLPVVGVPSAILQRAAVLNVPFTTAEVAHALNRLNNHRAAGLSGVCAEFFRYAKHQPPPVDGRMPPAEHVLLQPLVLLMNAVFKQGVVPKQWDLSLITPVHKRGSTLNTSNYRPIAVGEPLARLYAVLLQTRLDLHLEGSGLRSDSQAGFRKKLSTSHQLFVLQHFIDKCCRDKKPLYACWVDLHSAYDLVVRHILWSCMARKGIHGDFLTAVKSLYATPQYAVCVEGLVGCAVSSVIGVRQGCPLSPLLFGIMLDDLPIELSNSVHHAPCLGAYSGSEEHMHGYRSRPVTNLDFADDVFLLSTSLQGTQGLLREFHFFCLARGMVVSAAKTRVIRLAPSHVVETYNEPLQLNGQVLHVQSQGAKYLGLFVDPVKGVRSACADLRQRSHNAWMALNRNKYNLKCESSLPILLRLYAAVVRPVMLYGSEVWALLPGGITQRRKLYIADHKHLASLAGVPTGTSEEALYLALGCISLEWETQLRAVRFWVNLWALPASNFYRHVAFDNWATCCAGSKNFARGMLDFLNGLGPSEHTSLFTTESLRKVPLLGVDKVLQLLLQKRQGVFDKHIAVSPSIATDGVVLCSYLHYHALPLHSRMVLLYELPLSIKACRVLLRFMLGVSLLPLHAGRHSPHIPRAERVCLLCTSGSLADEKHMIFDCPALQHLRTGEVFGDLHRRNSCTVVGFMRHTARFGVAGFLLRALNAYSPPAHTP